MKISIYLSVLLLALVIKIVTADGRTQLNPKHYCGSSLADIMRLLCKGKYNEKIKRGEIDLELMDSKDTEDYYNPIDYSYQPPRQEVMSFIPSRFLRTPKSRIIDECCFKPCYITELQGYCAPQ